MSNNEESRSLASEYAEYLKQDLQVGAKSVEDSIEEYLTRLDEYSNLLGLVSVGSSPDRYKSFDNHKISLDELFLKIRQLEYVVQRVKQDVDRVEEIVENAETDLKMSSDGGLLNILRPLLKRGNTTFDPAERTNQLNALELELFKTKDFFP